MFNVLFYQPFFNLLIFCYRLFGENLGLAIIAVGFISRLIIYPLTSKQLDSVKKNEEFKKEYDSIKKKYSKNQQKQSEEMAKVQAKYLPGQLSGCLPLIFQLIFLVQIRNVIVNLFEHGTGAFNYVAYSFIPKFAEGANVNLFFLGTDLSKTANQIGLSNYSTVWPYILLAVSVGLSQFLSTWMMTGLKPVSKDSQTEKKKDKNTKEAKTPDFGDMMQSSSKQMLYLFPIITVFFSLNFISGLSLYWTVQSLFVIIQQLINERKKFIEMIKAKLYAEPKLIKNS